MKRIITMLFAVIISMTTFAQKDVTKFLGIPIDGTMSEMKAKLKAKGFKADSYLHENQLCGTFNGLESIITLVSNNNKIWRVVVTDLTPTDETNIRIRYNKLLSQFKRNRQYVNLQWQTNNFIEENENISYNMDINNKRYEAVFYQLPSDTLAIRNHAQNRLLEKYTEEQIENPTTDQTFEMGKIVDQACWEILEKRAVWFMISEIYEKYCINIYYDNGYNQADGEDL